MRNQSLMSEVTNLLFKGHEELARLVETYADSKHGRAITEALHRTFPQPSFSINVNGYSLTGEVVDGNLTLSAKQGDLHYQASVPTRAKSIEDLTATITVTKPSQWAQEFKLSGKDFLAGTNVPKELIELHSTLVSYVTRAYPWLKPAKSEKTAALDAAVAAAQARAQSGAPEVNPSKSENTVALEAAVAAAQAAAQNAAPDVKADEPIAQSNGSIEADFQVNQKSAKGGGPVLRDFIIHRSNGKTLKFNGHLLASTYSSPRSGRYWELGVFKTRGERYIGVKIGRTMWPGESDKVEALVFETVEELQGFLGDSHLAKVLYAKAGFDFFEYVE